MAAPTILTLGTEAQRQRYLRPLFTCEEIWCQLFSEPGAGSDVASLATRAERDGDEWILNGQKVWTTLAHRARFGIVLARTDPEAEKHRGITYFVVDMKAPGVEVRPLRQATGDAEFNEVFFNDVRIPDDERLGDVGDGWRGALVTLMNERVSIGGAVVPHGRRSDRIPPSTSGTTLTPERQDGATRDRLMRLWVEAEVQRITNARAAANSKAGTPGPEGSTGKLAFAELNKRIYDLCVDLLGPEGMLYDSYEMSRPETAGAAAGSVQRMFLRARANSIEGGHLRGHAQHPGRAGARPPRRRADRQGAARGRRCRATDRGARSGLTARPCAPPPRPEPPRRRGAGPAGPRPPRAGT